MVPAVFFFALHQTVPAQGLRYSFDQTVLGVQYAKKLDDSLRVVKLFNFFSYHNRCFLMQQHLLRAAYF